MATPFDSIGDAGDVIVEVKKSTTKGPELLHLSEGVDSRQGREVVDLATELHRSDDVAEKQGLADRLVEMAKESVLDVDVDQYLSNLIGVNDSNLVVVKTMNASRFVTDNSYVVDGMPFETMDRSRRFSSCFLAPPAMAPPALASLFNFETPFESSFR